MPAFTPGEPQWTREHKRQNRRNTGTQTRQTDRHTHSVTLHEPNIARLTLSTSARETANRFCVSPLETGEALYATVGQCFAFRLRRFYTVRT